MATVSTLQSSCISAKQIFSPSANEKRADLTDTTLQLSSIGTNQMLLNSEIEQLMEFADSTVQKTSPENGTIGNILPTISEGLMCDSLPPFSKSIFQILTDFLSSTDTEAACAYLIATQQPSLHHIFIYEIIIRAIDSTENVENSLVMLLHALVKGKVVCVEQFLKVNK